MTKYDKYFSALIPQEDKTAVDGAQALNNAATVRPEDLQAVESRINKAIEDSINRLESRLKVSADTNNISNQETQDHSAENSAEKE